MMVCRRVRFTKGGSVMKTDKILIVTKILVKLNLSIFGELSGHSNGPLFDTGFQVATTAGWGLLGYKQGLSSELRSLSLTITTV